MLGNAFGWPHLLIILAVVLLLFGATKLPALAKSMGQSMKVFRNEIKSDETKDDGEKSTSAESSQAESSKAESSKAESTKDATPTDKS